MSMRCDVITLCLLGAVACAEPGNKDAHLSGPDATEATRAVSAWAASVDADTMRARPVRCDLPVAAAEGAEVTVHRPNDSTTRIVVEYRGPNGRAIENYYARSDVVRLFVRVDESYPDGTPRWPGKRNEDSLWFAEGKVERWVDSLNRSRSLGVRSVGARAGNIQRFYDDWRQAVRNCR